MGLQICQKFPLVQLMLKRSIYVVPQICASKRLNVFIKKLVETVCNDGTLNQKTILSMLLFDAQRNKSLLTNMVMMQ